MVWGRRQVDDDRMYMGKRDQIPSFEREISGRLCNPFLSPAWRALGTYLASFILDLILIPSDYIFARCVFEM